MTIYGLLFEIVLLLATGVATLGVILAAMYDVKHVRLRAKHRTEMRRLSYPKQPDVRICIVGVRVPEDLNRSLKSIKQIHYRHYDVVAVIDNKAVMSAKRLMRQELKTWGTKARAYTPRQAYPMAQLLSNSVRYDRKDQLLLVIRAGDALDTHSLKHAVAWLQLKPRVDAVQLSTVSSDFRTIEELVYTLGKSSARLVEKSLALFSRSNRAHESGTLYQIGAFKKQGRLRIAYDSGATYYESRGSYRYRISSWLMIGSLVYLTMIAYGLYVQVTWGVSTPLVLGWMVVSIWLLAAIWFDENNSFWRKSSLSIAIPMSYFAIASTLVVTGLGKCNRH